MPSFQKPFKQQSVYMNQELNLYKIFLKSFSFVALIYFFFFLDLLTKTEFSSYGLIPRGLSGAFGIISSPFIHGSWEHIINNSIPLLVLGMSIHYFYKEVAWKIYLWSILITGIWVWAFARPVIHIGASGVLYSFASFVFISGIIRKNYRLFALSMLVVFWYGGMVWGILPIKHGISWESHLMGALTGVLLAINCRKIGWSPVKYDWEEEEEDADFHGINLSPDDVIYEEVEARENSEIEIRDRWTSSY